MRNDVDSFAETWEGSLVMTTDQIVLELSKVKKISRVHAFRLLKAAAIAPVGARQRPQQYPENSVARLLSYLGFEAPETGKLISRPALRAARKGGRKWAVTTIKLCATAAAGSQSPFLTPAKIARFAPDTRRAQMWSLPPGLCDGLPGSPTPQTRPKLPKS
jgi:hypothetical protein